MLRCQFFPTWSQTWHNPNQNSNKLFCGYQQSDNQQNDSKAYTRRPKTQKSQYNTKEKQCQKTDITWLQGYSKGIVIKRAWYYRRNKQINGI